jgi:hypothetical protein
LDFHRLLFAERYQSDTKSLNLSLTSKLHPDNNPVSFQTHFK